MRLQLEYSDIQAEVVFGKRADKDLYIIYKIRLITFAETLGKSGTSRLKVACMAAQCYCS